MQLFSKQVCPDAELSALTRLSSSWIFSRCVESSRLPISRTVILAVLFIHFSFSISGETLKEEIEAYENKRQLLELDVLHALRVLKAFQQTRQQLLDRMCVGALGQFEAFDEQTLLKLSDHEKQYLKDACAAEHSRRDEFNARNVGDKNGKPSAVRFFLCRAAPSLVNPFVLFL